MKNGVITSIGVVGGVVAQFFGGWDMGLQTLVLFMAVDIISGWIVGFMGRSPKTETGALSSHAGWYGLCKKGMILFIVLVAAQLDRLTGTEFIRNSVIIGYVANEALSIIENAGFMGVPAVKPLVKFIDALKKKYEGSEDNED